MENQSDTMNNEVAFEIGGWYCNRIGQYEVLGINGDQLRVLYEKNRTEDTLSMEIQKRIISNIALEEKRESSPFENSSLRSNPSGYRKFHFTSCPMFYQTLGFLSKRGEIFAAVCIGKEKSFKDHYREIKNHDPVSYYCTLDNKWSYSLRITLKTPEFELDLGNIKPVRGFYDNEIYIHSNSLVWWLFEIGFDLGKKHDIESIRLAVPNEYVEFFELGLTS